MNRFRQFRSAIALLGIATSLCLVGTATADVGYAGPDLGQDDGAQVDAWAPDVDTSVEYAYDDPVTGSGTLLIDAYMSGGEFDVLLRDSEDGEDACEIRIAYHLGTVFESVTEECDLEHFLDVLHVVFPDRVAPDMWEMAVGRMRDGGGDDDGIMPPVIDPGYGREDGDDDDALCMAAQGECAGMIIGGVVAGIGVGAVATPFAGVLVGVAAEAAAAMVCVGKISAYCGTDDLTGLIQELLGDWMDLFFDVDQFVQVEDLIDYLRSYLGGGGDELGRRAATRRGLVVPVDLESLLPEEVPQAAWADIGVQFAN